MSLDPLVHVIAIDRLRFNPDRVKFYLEQPCDNYSENLHQIMTSVGHFGLTHPIQVMERDDEDYFVIDGHLRIQACRMLFRTEIEAIVVPGTAEGTRTMLDILHEVKLPAKKPVAKKGKKA